jgi:hypothetical protein
VLTCLETSEARLELCSPKHSIYARGFGRAIILRRLGKELHNVISKLCESSPF